MSKFILPIMITVLMSCASDDPLPPVDPTGNWNLTTTFGTGNCELTGTALLKFTVTEKIDSYVITTTGANTTIEGVFKCDKDTCKLSMTETETIPETETDDGSLVVMTLNATMDIDGKVTGNGSIALTVYYDGPNWNCNQQFALTGDVEI